MNKTSRLVLVVLLTLSMLLASIANVKAVEDEEEYSGEFSLTTENVNVKVGDEVSIKVNITNIKGFKGIATFVAHKVYDESIFEYKGIEPASGWQLKADNVNMVLNSSENHASGTIAIMKFKAIKDIGNTTIKLDSIDAGGEDFDGEIAGICYKDNNVNEPSVKFTVVPSDGENNPGGDGNQGGNNNPSGDNNQSGNKKPDSGSSTTNKNDKTTAKGDKIPETGEPYMMFALLGITILVAGVLFAKYKMFANKMK